MKKAIAPLLMIAGLALSGLGSAPVATATAPALAPVAVTASEPITADSGAVVTAETVEVSTVAAPIEPIGTTTDGTPVYNLVGIAVAETTEPVVTVAPAPTAEPVVAPVEPVVAPVASTEETAAPVPADGSQTVYAQVCPSDWYKFAGGECVDPAAPTAPVAPSSVTADGIPVYNLTGVVVAETVSYPAPEPTYTCQEDQPCWDCATMGNMICGNPACISQNLFTIDTAGTCSKAPSGFTEAEIRAEGAAMAKEIGRGYIMSGSNSQMQRREGFSYVPSRIAGNNVIHVFS